MIDDDIRHQRIAERERYQKFAEASCPLIGNSAPLPSLSQWRVDMLTLISRILFVLGLFMLIPSLIIALSLQEFWRLLVDVSILAFLGGIAFLPQLSFALRTMLLLGLLYGVSVLWLILNGLVGNGRLYFVLLIGLAALLLNLRGTLLVWLLALLSIAMIYWGFATAMLPLPLPIVGRMFTPATLMTHWLAETLVSGIIVAAIVLTINWLQHSFRTAEEARVQLQRLNEQLEQRVAERTAELLHANDQLQAEITERRQSEEALRASERFVQQITATIPGILYVYDLILERNVYSNRQMADILGYTPEEVQAMGQDAMPTLLHPDDLPRAAEYRTMQAQATEGAILCFEYRMRSREGSWRWLLSREVVFTRAANGQPQQILGIAQDITERKQVEEAYRNLVDFSIQGLLIMQEGRVVFANPTIETIHGYTVAELQAMSAEELLLLVYLDDRPGVQQYMQHNQGSESKTSRREHRIICKDGQTRWVEVYVVQVDFRGTIAFQFTLFDITERKQAEKTLRESKQRLQAIFDNAAVGIGLTDNVGRSIIANARGAYQLGYTPEELAQCSNLELTHPDDRAETVERMQQLVRGDIQGYRIEKRYIHKDGSIFWADLSVSAVYDDEGQIAYLLGIVVDITARKQLEQQLHQANVLLQEQAIRDPLTGLYNRRYLDEALPRELQRAERRKQPIGVIMIDVDHFKRFNDTYGHAAGDTLLRAVGTFLKSHTRGEDIICRYGGEEFILVLPGTLAEDACHRAEELRAGIQTLVAVHQGQTLDKVTASLGIAIFPMHGSNADALVRTADQALYQAKHSGRNQVVMADNAPAC